MCQNAEKTAASMMEALEPEFKGLLTVEGQLTTPEGQAAVSAYEAAYKALLNWTPGSISTIVLESVQAFQAAFQAVVPLLPPGVGALVNWILAAIAAVIGVVKANSPAPAPAVDVPSEHAASPAEYQHAYAKQIEAETEAQVVALVPHFKRSMFHSAGYQTKKGWNDLITDGGFPETLHVN